MQGKVTRRPLARLEWKGRQAIEPAPAKLEMLTEVFPGGTGDRESAVSGRLYLSDNSRLMAALLPEYEGQLDLIYVDPPFLSGNTYPARIGRGEDSRKPEDWDMTEGYQDTWSDGRAYLNMLLPRLQLMYRLLSPSGTLYLHLDWHVAAYARILLDEIFGPDRLLNEIIWVYHGPSPIRSAFNRKHDTILVYTKSSRYTFNVDEVRVPYDASTVKTFEASRKAGFGKTPDLERGKVPEDWWYFPVVARLHTERTGYPTQKPEALLERIILASSNPGDLVADFFSGSGTTATVAARHGRQWIACDAAPLAVQTTYRRLLLEPEVSPYALWKDRDLEWEASISPGIKFTQEERKIAVRLEDLTDSQAGTRFPENVVLWEVDWHSSGDVFRSRSQAVRAWRKDEIPLQLAHTFPSEGSYGLQVRAMDTLGAFGSTRLEVQVND